MKQLFLILIALTASAGFSQNSLSDLLNKYNKKNIAYISVQELTMPKTNAVILDARETNEFNTSHIKNAIHVGYNHFNIESIQTLIPDKTTPIVVYCSIGIRSETIAHKLKKQGYAHVSNLYGGIFEWKKNDFPVYDSEEKLTDEVHVFSKEWGKWLTKGKQVY
ncbi:rhodanese-like domain-containing protein [Mariniflexile gromovii]|uniref:Rhodanese-like domain-containing protein n=1 Tax=Mariniflexile gromovii TaxID=362523 RepID=A0ABS4BSE7_9FLAO|nr:rhodanese-like domain-containing protein [Mariniflexile gromovii]MBP0903503.1 rhodanese-like domain-containing protein [Mariniflexile gromovii]